MPSIFHVDAFASEPFAGNPAAVCLLEKEAPDAWMQNVAAAMNLSETAFLLREEDHWSLRWMTPAAEVDLCGHATLASAHVLFTERAHASPIRFSTRSGVLEAARTNAGIQLDFPARHSEPADPPAGLLAAFGLSEAVAVQRFRRDVLIVLDTEDAVRAVDPDYRALLAIDVRAVMVTAPGQDVDFVSRFFAPSVGVDEDPVTGSAHCVLGTYWSERLGKTAFQAAQLSKRGGRLGVELQGDRVLLRGHAVTTLRG
ncbi:MAG: PhzF family phenazine biosynthesis protein, partial [Myxococcota bacterium]